MNHIEPFWDDEYKKLNYRKEVFNDEYTINEWRNHGYKNPLESFSGEMANHSDVQPSWTETFIDLAKYQYELKDVGACYYRMGTNEIIPNHSDAYKVYTEKFNCKQEDVHRILVFLEDWKSGHYFEMDGHPIVNWKSGNYIMWRGEVEHMAGNIGVDYRYTLQITGHK